MDIDNKGIGFKGSHLGYRLSMRACFGNVAKAFGEKDRSDSSTDRCVVINNKYERFFLHTTM
jgi:hypothetical protein